MSGVSAVGAETVREETPAKCSPRVTVVILMASLVSTCASMAGGLVMYFEGLESLEDTVRDTSHGELTGVVGDVRNVLDKTQQFSGIMRRFAFSDERLTSLDPYTWGNITRSLLYAQVASTPELYSAGIVLVPHLESNNSAFYSNAWSDVLASGEKEYVHGLYGSHLPQTEYFPLDNSTPPEVLAMKIHTNALDPATGYIDRFLYTWDGKSYITSMLYEWDPRDGGLPVGDGWRPGEDGSVAMKWRPPGAWYAADNNPYTYSGVDMVFVPPPAPHPWSSYKAVMVSCLFLYSSWEDILQKYAKGHEDTTVMIIDSVTEVMYASTTGNEMIDKNCYSGFTLQSPMKCSTKLHNLSAAAQDAYEALRDEPFGHFIKAGLDGERHFLRKAQLHENAVVIWFRPVSSVEGKVQEALTLLIVFTAIVLAFDLTVGALEIWYIALPMKKLSLAITSLGRMETADANTLIAACQQTVMLFEVRRLMDGMTVAIARLTEYKAFMPDAVLQAEEAGDIQPPEGEVALVFTDIVRSTDLWEAVPEAMALGMDLHNKAIRRCLVRHRGYEVKTIGDAFMIAFQSPVDAVAFACETQEILAEEPWPEELLQFPQSQHIAIGGDVAFSGLRVRMGVHYGPVELEINPLTERADYRGGCVNKAARVESQALPGMVAVTEEVHVALGTDDNKDLDPGFSLYLLGRCDLKGIGVESISFACTALLEKRRERWAIAMKMMEEGKDLRFNLNQVLNGVSADKMGNTKDPTKEFGRDQSTVVSQRTQNAAAKDIGLERRFLKTNGALVNIRLNRVLDTLRMTDEPARLLSMVNTSFQVIVDCAAMTECRVEGLIGTTVTASWNCTSRCSAYITQCLRFCALVEKRRTGLHIGAVCGPLTHGFTGSTTKKYHTVVGAAVRYSEVLVEHCPQYLCNTLLVVSGGVSADFAHCCVPVDVWSGTRGFEPTVVVERLDRRQAETLNAMIGDETEDRFNCPYARLRAALMRCLVEYTRVPLQQLAETESDATVSRLVDTFNAKEQLVTQKPIYPDLSEEVRSPSELCASFGVE